MVFFPGCDIDDEPWASDLPDCQIFPVRAKTNTRYSYVCGITAREIIIQDFQPFLRSQIPELYNASHIRGMSWSFPPDPTSQRQKFEVRADGKGLWLNVS